ncbi:MAG: MBOAT family protein, partial [Lachnospiraceae bacterium]|nr:MBOAT family protein [Lachnospiraceae bacterium]
MVYFSSIEFLFRFLIVFLAVYYITPAKIKNYVLLLGSVILYSVGQPLYMMLMLASIALNYWLARKITVSKQKKNYLIIAIVFDVGSLVIFKYLGFVIDNINAIIGYETLPTITWA